MESLNRGKIHNDSSDHRKESVRQAINSTIATFVVTLLFWTGTWYYRGFPTAMEFITSFLVEKSLSIDNLFVFLMLFELFRVPEPLQNRVLTWGLVGAISMRGFMVFVGIRALAQCRWIMLLFAGILLLSSIKLLQESHQHLKRAATITPTLPIPDSRVVCLSRIILRSTDQLDGENFFTVGEDGKHYATPLFVCLLCIELSDFVFAVDSIPAVLSISQDPFVVYASNVFAILGLRSMYTLLSVAVRRLRFLRPTVALLLAFVAGKMLGDFLHFQISAELSLMIIAAILGAGIVTSLLDEIHPEI